MHMKTVLLMLGLALTFQARAQLFLTQTGETRFFSKAPLEDISAINKKTGAVLNTQNGDVVVRVPITEFQFPNKLMQEHFNENYLESDKFPYAMFRGKLQDVPDLSKPGSYDVSAKGSFDLHGVKLDRVLKGKLVVDGEKITLTSEFQVALVDHKIDIPKIVFQKIAETVDVRNTFVLVKK
ncbi:hypothetical protein SAMN04488090_2579 [Siphonobacter aquaeclarae]|uniref:Lipid/polyisoprenoid-binding YceI-like domain-containing protein n=2 Tax=Siphonobacter aquaeclarae TaxID=563176 RepID=A0A1G9QE02_9BACT|nr:hypothetical protein SAMN04488090_2579 [Siphonobacter aquaeclarae]